MTKYKYLDLTAEQRATQPRDGMQWDDLIADDEYYDVYTMYCENADGITDIEYTRGGNGLDFTYTDSDGTRHYVYVKKID